MKNKILYTLFLFCMITVRAQQNSLYNTYSLDPLQLNIAYAGAACTEANLHYRTQWLGLKETPKNFQVNAHTALSKSNAVALRINSQSMGLLNNTGVTLGYSYRFMVSRDAKIHMGLGVGWSQAAINTQKAIVTDVAKDVTLNNYNRQTANGFDSEFGAMFIGKKLKAGFSALHLYNSNPDFSGSNAYKVLPQLNTQVSYLFNAGEKFEIDPVLLHRYTLNGNSIVEGLVNVSFAKTLLVGAGYRSSYGFLFLLGARVGPLKLGYSFDYGVSKNAAYLGTSHQVMLGFSFCKKARPLKEEDVQPAITQPTIMPTVTDPDTARQEVSKKEEPIVNEEAKQKTLVVKETPVAVEEKQEIAVEKTKPSIEALEPTEALAQINKIAEEVIFEFNKTQLSDAVLKKLDKIAGIMSKAPELNINIIGHTCNIGTKQVNELISIRRATYLRNELIERGVNTKRINDTIGVGAEQALYGNDTLESQQKNRTVRFESAK